MGLGGIVCKRKYGTTANTAMSCELHIWNGHDEIPSAVVFIVSFTLASWGKGNWSERHKKPGSMPLLTQALAHPDLLEWSLCFQSPLAVKMLICFRWRARLYVGWTLCLAFLKLYVNLQVTRLLNKSLDGVPESSSRLGWHFLMFLSLAETTLTGWHQCGGKRQKKKKLVCDVFKCNVQQLPLFFSESLRSTPLLLVTDGLSHCNPCANKHDYERSLDLLNSPSRLDWVWQSEEGMDIMDNTNFNEKFQLWADILK